MVDNLLLLGTGCIRINNWVAAWHDVLGVVILHNWLRVVRHYHLRVVVVYELIGQAIDSHSGLLAQVTKHDKNSDSHEECNNVETPGSDDDSNARSIVIGDVATT
jgi:hypothetical protein